MKKGIQTKTASKQKRLGIKQDYRQKNTYIIQRSKVNITAMEPCNPGIFSCFLLYQEEIFSNESLMDDFAGMILI